MPEPSQEILCRLTGVGTGHRFGGPWAVTGANLTLRPGTIVEVAGPDGAGKSTLLNLIAGSAEPTTGTVTRTYHGSEYIQGHLPSGLMQTGLMYLRNMAAEGRTRDAANARVRTISRSEGAGWAPPGTPTASGAAGGTDSADEAPPAPVGSGEAGEAEEARARAPATTWTVQPSLVR